MNRLTAPAILLLSAALVASGQSSPLSFEVASVKVHAGPLSRIFDYSSSGARLTLEAYPIAGLIMEAYNLKRPDTLRAFRASGRGDLLRHRGQSRRGWRPLQQRIPANAADAFERAVPSATPSRDEGEARVRSGAR